MREAAARLMARDQLGRDFFARGVPEDVTRIRHVSYSATLLDLMHAYARIRTKDEFRPFVMDRDHVFTMEQALDRMRGLIGYAGDWTDLVSFLPEGWDGAPDAPPLATAAHFAAMLELAKRGPDRPAAGRDLRADPDPAEGGMMPTTNRRAKPVRRAADGRTGAHGRGDPVRHGRAGDAGRTDRAAAAWLRPGRGAGASAQAL